MTTKYQGFDVSPSTHWLKYPDQQDTPELNQRVFLTISAFRHWSFVVEVYVNEIVLILHRKGTAAPNYESRWYCLGGPYDPQTDSIAIPPENFNEWEVVNCWYWVDEPVAGHAIYGRDDGVYVDLRTAMQNCRPWKSARRKEVQKALRKHRENWLRWCRPDKSNQAQEGPAWSPIPKRTWVRRN